MTTKNIITATTIPELAEIASMSKDALTMLQHQVLATLRAKRVQAAFIVDSMVRHGHFEEIGLEAQYGDTVLGMVSRLTTEVRKVYGNQQVIDEQLDAIEMFVDLDIVNLPNLNSNPSLDTPIPAKITPVKPAHPRSKVSVTKATK